MPAAGIAAPSLSGGLTGENWQLGAADTRSFRESGKPDPFEVDVVMQDRRRRC